MCSLSNSSRPSCFAHCHPKCNCCTYILLSLTRRFKSSVRGSRALLRLRARAAQFACPSRAFSGQNSILRQQIVHPICPWQKHSASEAEVARRASNVRVEIVGFFCGRKAGSNFLTCEFQRETSDTQRLNEFHLCISVT